MKEGLFITLEGCDGSGKTTQAGLIEELLTKKGYEVLRTREPGGTSLSEALRNIILSPNYAINPYAEALMYAAARSQHVMEVIRPAVLAGKAVVCDRFFDSSLAYQAYARGLGTEFVVGLFESTTDSFYPDMTFWLDITPLESFKRKGGADGKDRIELEGIDFHTLVYDGFSLAHSLYPNRIIKIDAQRNKELIFEEIEKHLLKALKNPKKVSS